MTRFLKHFGRARQQQTWRGPSNWLAFCSGDPEYVQQDTTARRLVTSNRTNCPRDVFILVNDPNTPNARGDGSKSPMVGLAASS